MRDFRREFSFSKDSCERNEIDDESRRESQVDVFIAVILSLRTVFSLNHLAVFVALALVVFVFVTLVFVALVFVVLVFVVVAFFLRARM
jgi:uncharacterized membrane protein